MFMNSKADPLLHLSTFQVDHDSYSFAEDIGLQE